MLESHNDSAVAIAEHISGSVEVFTEKMNRKAQDIGCVDTTFLTPNGLDAEKQNADGEVIVMVQQPLSWQKSCIIVRKCLQNMMNF